MLAGAGQAGAALTQAGPAVTQAGAAVTAAGAPVTQARTAVTAGTITTVAGGVGGPAKATTVAVSPCGARFAGGNLYIGDIAAIRQISPATDQLTTPVGTGSTTPLGDAGPATRASLNGSCTAARDPAGNLVVADIFDNRIRLVAAAKGTFYGKPMTAGNIYSVAGNGTFGFSGDGGPAASAELRYPQSVAVDGAGNLVITDTHSNRIRVVAATTGTFYGRAMTTGDIYTVAGNGSGGFSGDGGPATSAGLSLPQDVTVDRAGNLVIADTGNAAIRVVADRTGTFYGRRMTAGDIYTVAGTGGPGFSGDGGPATSATLFDPSGVAVDGSGNLVIADFLNFRVRVVAETTGTFYGVAMTAGDIYTVAGDGTFGFSGDGGPATSTALAYPDAVAVDDTGDLVVADQSTSRIRQVTG
jgi:hypothetical protein